MGHHSGSGGGSGSLPKTDPPNSNCPAGQVYNPISLTCEDPANPRYGNTPSGTQPNNTTGTVPQCPNPQMHWDPAQNTCVYDPPCPPGSSYHADLQGCFSDTDPTKPTTPTGGGGGGGGGGATTALTAGKGGAAATTPAEDSLTQAVSELARMLAGQAAGLYNVGFPAYSQAVSYYESLLGRGGRAGANVATAPAAEGIAQNYQGAQTSLLSGYLRGGARDQALADLERSKAADIAHLTTGVQPQAASALAQAGLGGATAGLGGTAESANLYGGLLQNQTQQSQFATTLAENQRQFNLNLQLQRDALAKMNTGGGGGQNVALAQQALDEQKREFDAQLAAQKQQQTNQSHLALGSTIGTLVGGLFGSALGPAGKAGGSAVGGGIGGLFGGGGSSTTGRGGGKGATGPSQGYALSPLYSVPTDTSSSSSAGGFE